MAKKTQETRAPEHTIRVGTVQVTIWKNTFDDGGESFSFVLVKNYLDKDNNWQTTNSLKANELMFASRALEMAFDWRYKRENDKENSSKGGRNDF